MQRTTLHTGTASEWDRFVLQTRSRGRDVLIISCGPVGVCVNHEHLIAHILTCRPYLVRALPSRYIIFQFPPPLVAMCHTPPMEHLPESPSM